MKHQPVESFKRRIWIIFALMGLMPILVGLYFLTSQDIEITQAIYALGATVSIGVLVSFLMTIHFAEDLSSLTQHTMQVAFGQSHQPVNIAKDSLREIDSLSKSFNAILHDLEESRVHSKEVSTHLLVYANALKKYQEKLRQESLVRAKFSRYVGDDVLEHLVNSGKELAMQNVRREVTVLFADIRSFTALSEHMGPEEVIEMLNEYFTIMVKIVFKHQGILDKFIGDGLMAVFGMIGDRGNAALDAVSAALDMRLAQAEFMDRRQQEGKRSFEIGIGINTGEAVVGNVGSQNRSDFTVIGDTVNVGARLEQMAKGHEIIVGEKTYHYCKDDVHMEFRGDIKVKNRTGLVACFTVTDKVEQRSTLTT